MIDLQTALPASTTVQSIQAAPGVSRLRKQYSVDERIEVKRLTLLRPPFLVALISPAFKISPSGCASLAIWR